MYRYIHYVVYVSNAVAVMCIECNVLGANYHRYTLRSTSKLDRHAHLCWACVLNACPCLRVHTHACTHAHTRSSMPTMHIFTVQEHSQFAILPLGSYSKAAELDSDRDEHCGALGGTGVQQTYPTTAHTCWHVLQSTPGEHICCLERDTQKVRAVMTIITDSRCA